MNPWVSVWFHPRQTIRHIVDTNPRQGVLLLAMVAGASGILMLGLRFAVSRHLSLYAVIPLGVAGGAILGMMRLYLSGWLYRWIGSWFGGTATSVEIRAALAWVEVLTLVGFGMLVAVMLATRGALLTAEEIANGSGVQLLSVGVSLAMMAIGIWKLVLTCHTIGEVHRFSAWKGLGTLVVPGLLVVPAMIAAIAIPNVLRGRIAENESAAVGNLAALARSLEMYRSAHNSFPDAWLTDMYPTGSQAFGPETFASDLQGGRVESQGYVYRYTPTPERCAEPACTGYQLTATSPIDQARKFFLDESGQFRHCKGKGFAKATDPSLEGDPGAC